jgi:aminoglycoside phosphotransferase (APT) family kinase protein
MKSFNEGIDQISERLIAYIRDELNDPTIEYDSPLTQLHGGFETRIYRFMLKNIEKELSKPLILRLYPEFYGPEQVVWESAIHNVLSAEGFPVPKAHGLCTDMSILGGAFFIMDFLPGKPMITEPMETIPELLGKTHAALHRIDPKPLIKSLGEQGIDESLCRLDNRFEGLKDKAGKFTWLRSAVDWLIGNRPPEPEKLAACHADFHPLNILVQDGKVTGVLDWSSFLIADPALDLANTIALVTIVFKHIAPTLGLDFSSVDLEIFAEQYLDAYQAEKPLDKSHLNYYQVRRCVYAHIEGSEGQAIWQNPLIVKDLNEFIHRITGIRITVPD